MLGGISGGDPFEIVVALKDLTERGFGKLRGEISSTERAANTANLGGFSKQAKTLEKDAEAAAGHGGSGGIGGLATGLMGLAGGPVTLAVAGIGAVVAGGIELTKTYDEIEVQEKALAIAAKDHGIAVDQLTTFVDESIKANEQYGFGATDTRAAITKLTEAGMSLADQQQAMGPIADLARAKNLSLADASRQYELAIMGNAKALKEYGIALPKVGSEEKALTAAQKQADGAAKGLTSAQNALKLTEDSLAGKHKLTAAEALRLQLAHEKVTAAQTKNKAAQEALTAAQAKANDVGTRSKTVNDAITKAVGDQRKAVSPLEQASTKLGNMWQRLATSVGPPLEAMFAGILDVLGNVFSVVLDVGSALAGPLTTAFNIVTTPIRAWLSLLGGIFEMLRRVLGFIGEVGNAIAHSGIGSFIGSVGGAIGSIGNMIPHFASGGVVNPRPGGTLILAGEAGEREYVIPESKLGGVGGGTSVMHIHLNVDGQELAYAMERPLGSLFALRGTSARLGSGA